MGLSSHRRHAIRYALVGILAGLVFPILAVWVELTSIDHLPLNASTLLGLSTNPLMWIILTAPVFLGILALMIGRRDDRLLAEQEQREREIQERTAEIAKANDDLADEISERRRIESVISHAKKEWEAIFDAVTDLILLVDNQGNVVRCNLAATRAFHLSFQELLGRPVQSLIFGPGSERTMDAAVGSQIAISGLAGWYAVGSFDVRREDGSDGLIYVIRDVTEQIHSQQEINRQKQFFEALVENLPVAIVTLDLEQIVVACNPAFEVLFGYSTLEAAGKSIDELVVPQEEYDKSLSYSQQVVAGGMVHTICQRKTKNNALVDVELFGVPVIVSGQRVGALGIYHDITDLQRARKAAELPTRPRVNFWRT